MCNNTLFSMREENSNGRENKKSRNYRNRGGL